jgi:hypothetical protein
MQLLVKHWGHRVAYDEIKAELAGVGGAAAGPASGERYPILAAAARDRTAEAIAASTGHPIPANLADIPTFEKGGKVKGGKGNKTAAEGKNATEKGSRDGGANAPAPAARIEESSAGGAQAPAPAAMEQQQQQQAQPQQGAAQGQPQQGGQAAPPPAEAQPQPQNQNQPAPEGGGGAQGQGQQGQQGPPRHVRAWPSARHDACTQACELTLHRHAILSSSCRPPGPRMWASRSRMS